MKAVTLSLILFAAPLPAASAARDVLRQAGKRVGVFWEQFSAINCTESVSQLRLGKDGKPDYRQDSVNDYLVLMRLADDDISVEESRVNVRSAAKGSAAPLLTTTGFPTLVLIFHPYFQGGFEYSQPEESEVNGRPALRVGFRHVRGARSPSCLRLRGRNYPIEWSGAAWIDPQSGVILRIAAAIQSEMEDLGLRGLEADVRYGSVRFSDAVEEFWLPQIATIEARTPKQHWRNVHRFTGYRHFTVKTDSRTELPH